MEVLRIRVVRQTPATGGSFLQTLRPARFSKLTCNAPDANGWGYFLPEQHPRSQERPLQADRAESALPQPARFSGAFSVAVVQRPGLRLAKSGTRVRFPLATPCRVLALQRGRRVEVVTSCSAPSCGGRSMARTAGFHPADEGSIPSHRTTPVLPAGGPPLVRVGRGGSTRHRLAARCVGRGSFKFDS